MLSVQESVFPVFMFFSEFESLIMDPEVWRSANCGSIQNQIRSGFFWNIGYLNYVPPAQY